VTGTSASTCAVGASCSGIVLSLLTMVSGAGIVTAITSVFCFCSAMRVAVARNTSTVRACATFASACLPTMCVANPVALATANTKTPLASVDNSDSFTFCLASS